MNAISGTRRTMKEMADGTIRVQIDIDPSCRADFLTLFPNIDMPVAIAPLVPDFERGMDTLPERVEETPESEHKERASGLWLLAVQWCKDPGFYEFIRPIYDIELGGNGKGHGDVCPDQFIYGVEDYCRHVILYFCDISSRRELNINSQAAAAFKQMIRGPYMAWMEHKG